MASFRRFLSPLVLIFLVVFLVLFLAFLPRVVDTLEKLVLLESVWFLTQVFDFQLRVFDC